MPEALRYLQKVIEETHDCYLDQTASIFTHPPIVVTGVEPECSMRKYKNDSSSNVTWYDEPSVNS